MTNQALNTIERAPKPTCVRCGSENLDHASEKQGFGFKKALVGGLALGPLGLLAGGINHRKTHVVLTCRDCFHSFAASDLTTQERKLRLVRANDKKKQEQNQLYQEAIRTPFRSAFQAAILFGPICGLIAKIFSFRPYIELAAMGIVGSFALFYLSYRSELSKQLSNDNEK